MTDSEAELAELAALGWDPEDPQRGCAEGSAWYAVPREWLAAFSAGRGAAGVLDTTGLVGKSEHPAVYVAAGGRGAEAEGSAEAEECGRLLAPGLLEGADFVMVPEAVWGVLVRGHGAAGATLGVRRHAVAAGEGERRRVEVETFPYALEAAPRVTASGVSSAEAAARRTVVASRRATAGAVAAALGAAWADLCGGRATRLWVAAGADRMQLVRDGAQTLEELAPPAGARLVLEAQDAGGRWHVREPDEAAAAAGQAGAQQQSWWQRLVAWIWPTDYDDVAAAAADALPRGVCGLGNLGNTCYMNSGLQCLSNTEALKQFFALGRHRGLGSAANRMGTRGEVTAAFAALLERMWSGRYRAVTPRGLRAAVARWAPQFAGSQQHDAHELVTFLVSALHEDMNSVAEKPYIEAVDCGDGALAEGAAARQAWDNVLRRDNSPMVDLFFGQLRRTVTCPDCGKRSVTFDPFTSLSLSIDDNAVELRTTLFPYRPYLAQRNPRTYGNRLAPGATVRDLKEAVSAQSGVPASSLRCAVLENSSLSTFLGSNTAIESLVGKTCVLYEIPETKFEDKPDKEGDSKGSNEQELTVSEIDEVKEIVWCVFVHRREGGGNWTPFGIPFVTICNRGVSGQKLYRKAWRRCRAFIATRYGETETGEGLLGGGAPPQHPAHATADYPFTLRVIAPRGGGAVPDTDAPVAAPAGDTLVIGVDWCGACTAAMSAEAQTRFEARLGAAVVDASARQLDAAHAPLTLDACMARFSTPEVLSGSNSWYCPACKEQKHAATEIALCRTPDVLVLHLKRFRFARYSCTKIHTPVDVPRGDWDIARFLQPPEGAAPQGTTYRLYAVINHWGSFSGGHYTALCLNHGTGRWYEFNDSHFTEMERDDVSPTGAYILFFERVHNR